jgi:Uma2 family endonuclease
MSTATLPSANAWQDDEALFEIIDGVRVEKFVSAENVYLANELSYHISSFARPRNLGRSMVEILFELPLPDRSRVRRPDLAYVSFERWPQGRPLPSPGNYWPVAPDLAVEFISPSEYGDEIIEKVREYLEAGVRCVWVIHTRHRYVMEFESLSRVRGLTDADELDGKDVLPGFRIPVSSLFPPRE